MSSPRLSGSPDGFTLVELVIVVSLVLIALSTVAPWSLADKWALARAGRLAESHLVRARLHALAGHEGTVVALSGSMLELQDRAGQAISRVELGGAGLRGLDSIRMRPAAIRFNERGQGSAGSIYLYRGRRGIRVLSNFLGRVRTTRLRI